MSRYEFISISPRDGGRYRVIVLDRFTSRYRTKYITDKSIFESIKNNDGLKSFEAKEAVLDLFYQEDQQKAS